MANIVSNALAAALSLVGKIKTELESVASEMAAAEMSTVNVRGLLDTIATTLTRHKDRADKGDINGISEVPAPASPKDVRRAAVADPVPAVEGKPHCKACKCELRSSSYRNGPVNTNGFCPRCYNSGAKVKPVAVAPSPKVIPAPMVKAASPAPALTSIPTQKELMGMGGEKVKALAIQYGAEIPTGRGSFATLCGNVRAAMEKGGLTATATVAPQAAKAVPAPAPVKAASPKGTHTEESILAMGEAEIRRLATEHGVKAGKGPNPLPRLVKGLVSVLNATSTGTVPTVKAETPKAEKKAATPAPMVKASDIVRGCYGEDGSPLTLESVIALVKASGFTVS